MPNHSISSYLKEQAEDYRSLPNYESEVISQALDSLIPTVYHMENEINEKTIADSAETVYIETPEASYGIFCFNNRGDLFLNSDYWLYGYAWRSYAPDRFRDFLAGCNSDYILGKFEINFYATAGKKINKHTYGKLKIQVEALIEYLKSGNKDPINSKK